MDFLDQDAELTHRLFRVNRTLYEMATDRQYEVPDSEKIDSLEQFKARYGSHPTVGQPSRSSLDKTFVQPDSGLKLAVFLANDAKVGVREIRDFIIRMQEEKANHAVIVVQNKLTPKARQALQECLKQGLHLECFQDSELIVNITHHKMVPKHELQTEEQKQELLARYKLQDHQLPRIKLSDPVAKYFGMKRGQVVKITRPSPTAGRYVTYRLVY